MGGEGGGKREEGRGCSRDWGGKLSPISRESLGKGQSGMISIFLMYFFLKRIFKIESGMLASQIEKCSG